MTDWAKVLVPKGDHCPRCGRFLKTLWSGVKCNGRKCGYRFCY